jgi:hypothetical protein
LFAKAKYLGPCGEVVKVKSITEGKILLTPRQSTIRAMLSYPGLYGSNFEEARFHNMDNIFNTIGNGINSKGDFLAHISVPEGTEIVNDIPKEGKKMKHLEDYVRNPYPNFSKQYSLLWEVSLDVFPVEWLEEAQWFYTKCQEFFESEKAGYYHSAYPNLQPRNSNTLEDWTKALEKRRKPEQTDEEFYAVVSKDYECPYYGDIEDFLIRRWKGELDKIMTFIKETLKAVAKELKSRKA